MTEIAAEAVYAAAVISVLRKHLPDFDPKAADSAFDAIARQQADPQDSFEVIVDNPYSARWRLKAKPGRDRGRVRLRCYRYNRCQSDNDLEDAVNDALEALESAPVTPGSGSEEESNA